MKKRIFGVLGILVAFVFLLSSCGLTEVEQSQEDYNYNKIIPKIMDFTGPTTVSASGLAASEYSVLYRGGSTYTFTAVGYGATIEIGEMPNHANVTWAQSSVDTSAILIAVETTQGGVVSDPDTLEITLLKFCPLTINDFIGDWTGTEAGDCSVDPINLTFVAGPVDNSIMVEATAGIPAMLGCIFTGWGETFQPGYGNEGDIILHIGLSDGTVTVGEDYWGQTLPGPWDYWTDGGGTWGGCGAAPTMNFGMELHWNEPDGSPNRSSTLTLTKVVTK